MQKPIAWPQLYADYTAAQSATQFGPNGQLQRQFPNHAVMRLRKPSSEDVQWLTQALKDDQRKWFVAVLAKRSKSLAKEFLPPLLDAGIDEINPSLNRYFIEAAITAFGVRLVIEYLLDAIVRDADFRKAGAVSAIYWTGVKLSFPPNAPSLDIEHATPESRAALDAIADLRERQRILLLETFVANANVDVRRSIVPMLRLNRADYSEEYRPLIDRAIDIARHSDDDYIRHRIEVQLGNEKLLSPIPHRSRK